MNKAFEETWKRAGWPDEVKHVYRDAFKAGQRSGMLHAAEIAETCGAEHQVSLDRVARAIRKLKEEI